MGDRMALRARIRGSGLRCTPGREAVLALLDEVGAPISHPELVDRLAPLGWDRAALYRNLTDLAGAGILRRVDHGDHIWRYELADDHRGDHPHFVCVSCGDVACIPEIALEIPAAASLPEAVRGGRVQLQLHGQCDECARPPS